MTTGRSLRLWSWTPARGRSEPSFSTTADNSAGICNHVVMADLGGEQHCARRIAVPALCRIFAHLRPDADPELDARVVFHAGCISRGHIARQGTDEFLA